MQKTKKKNKAPLILLLIFLSSIVATWYYISSESLNTAPKAKSTKKTDIQQQKTTYKNEIKEPTPDTGSLFSRYYRVPVEEEISTKEINYSELNSILNNLKNLSIREQNTPETIVDAFLLHKKYPKGLLKIEYEKPEYSAINNENTLTVAHFDFYSGKIKINKSAIEKITTEKLVAILAHEIEHFDTIAKTYKTYNLKEKNIVEIDKEKIEIKLDKNFWDNASEYANIKDFYGRSYILALWEYIKKEEIHTLSLYPFLKNVSKHINNALEIPAYSISDKILNYYKIKKETLSIKEMSNEFISLDEMISKNLNRGIKIDKEGIFDYLLIQTLIEKDQMYKNLYNESILYQNKDMTEILQGAIEENQILFSNRKDIPNQEYTKVTELLKDMKKIANETMTNDNKIEAMEIQINTMKNNIYKKTTLNVLKEKVIKYIKYIKENDINKEEQELNYLILLLCIENNIYTNTANSFNTFYSKMPSELFDIYEETDYKKLERLYKLKNKAEENKVIQDKIEQENKQRVLKAIYNNTIFIEQKENGYSELSNSAFLKELINENKINIKI